MLLYTFPWSNHAARVNIILQELNIPFDCKIVDLRGENRTPAYLAMNPNAKVPLIDDHGFILWESHAIMRYLCDSYNGGHWYPSDTQQRAKVNQWLDWSHAHLNTEAITINFNSLILQENGDLQKVQTAKQNIKPLLSVLNSALKSRDYLCDKISIADISLYTSVVYLVINGVDLGAYPEILRWYDAISERPSANTARLGMEEMKGLVPTA